MITSRDGFKTNRFLLDPPSEIELFAHKPLAKSMTKEKQVVEHIIPVNIIWRSVSSLMF